MNWKLCAVLVLSGLMVTPGEAGLVPRSQAAGGGDGAANKTSISRAAPGTNAPARGAQASSLAKPKATRSVAGQLLFKLKPDSTTASEFQQLRRDGKSARSGPGRNAELGAFMSKHGVRALQPAFRSALQAYKPSAKSLKQVASKRDALLRWGRMDLPEGVDVGSAIAELKTHPAIERVELVYEWHLNEIFGLPDGTTDPLINQQWHHTAVRAQAAWNYLTNSGSPPGGMHDVVVAVIDTGVDYNHEELIGNMWTNPGEIPGNNLDDDHNGFTNDVHGCSVTSDARSHSGDPMDLHGHGTHVAGIIAATAFNLKGGVGVAFNVQIMAIRAAQSSGVLTTTDIAEGILYAVDNGAEVINMSFGSYQRSQIVEDALEVALNQAVLVAAAGNDGLNGWEYPSYPAALPYVHGVMAINTEKFLAWFSNYGYDMAAPGEGILSTLPGNQYAAWTGTSMAAPIVAGAAALMRSFFWQRDIYSSRFLMGSLSAHGLPLDIYSALTEPPEPGVTMLENWLFDSVSISPLNNSNGIVNSGETIHIAIEAINRAGAASNVVATLRAQAEGAVFPDPYVTLVVSNVNYGNIGPWSTADNGFIYDAQGVLTGVSHPFVFALTPDCPNDHVIPFELTFEFRDGWNPSNTTTYLRTERFTYPVVRGRDLPTVISSDMELTSQDYWIVKGPVLIEPGVTVTVSPGTQLQWGGLSDDPYNPGPQTGSILVRGSLLVSGDATNAVSFFPSTIVSGQKTTITVEGGVVDLTYTKVRNPNVTGLRNVNHCYFDWDFGSSAIAAQTFTNSVFHKLRGGGSLSGSIFEGCLFDAGWLVPSSAIIRNCTFLQDNENNHPISLTPSVTTDKNDFAGKTTRNNSRGIHQLTNDTGFTYVTMGFGSSPLLQEADLIAQFFGGHLLTIGSSNEQSFVSSYIYGYKAIYGVPNCSTYGWVIGLTDDGHAGEFTWIDGSPLIFTNWATNYPKYWSATNMHVVCTARFIDGNCTGGEGGSWYGPWKNMTTTQIKEGGYYILKLPGNWTYAELNTPATNGQLLAWVRPQRRGSILYNAFLSKYWDPAVTHWMRITGKTSQPDTFTAMYDNYWGTASISLIDHMIVDYYDNFTSSHIDYSPPATNGFATTYPFVQDVLVNGSSLESVPVLESGRADFTVTFNRDMDTNVQPFVSFGPSPPHTDFSVLPRDDNFVQKTNGWTDARTWVGSAWITPVTGNGYHLMRISGAVAADDPWLVTGYDVGRFRFRVATTEVASMALQAEGLEGAIHLMWQQNDYSLLAGYNLYRCTNAAGTYVKLNATVIPVGYESYMDTNVTPAVPMFYKFTVLSTDFQESDPSGIASAAALDTIPPTITHAAVSSAPPSQGLHLTAVAKDNLQILGVSAYYRPAGGSNYTAMPMVNVSTTNWSVTIPGSAVQPPGLEYYLVASDGISQTYSGTPMVPHSVTVSAVPTLTAVTPNQGPASGGTQVTLAGTLFDAASTVTFGGALASDLVLVTANQITCLTPPHFPALVDVRVVNTNGTSATLLNGFRYVDTAAVVSLPATNGYYGSQVELPLSAANVTGLRAGSITVTFNSAVLSLVDVRLGALTAGWSVSHNLANPGRVLISLAGATSVTGSGSLAILKFSVVGSPTTSTALTLESVSLNDGAISASLSHGLFTVSGFFQLAGTVSYFSGSKPVPGTDLAMAGAGSFATTTATNGQYVITNIPTGSYTLTPQKTNDVAEITAYDASLVLQADAQAITLSSNQVLAADVTRNGAVSAMDAAYILEMAVGLIQPPFPGAGKSWEFVPNEIAYALINGDLTGQNFTAVLIGDVSGNWAPPSPPEPALWAADAKPANDQGASDVALVAVDRAPVAVTGEQVSRVLLQVTNEVVYSADLLLSYTPTNQPIVAVESGTDAGFAIASNTNTPGIIRVGLANSESFAIDGPLVLVRFPDSEPVSLHVNHISLNENLLPPPTTVNAAAFDSDNDGLINYDELNAFHTDPAMPDTDGDGMSDGAEVHAGTSPLGRSSVFTLRGCTVGVYGSRQVTWSAVPGKHYQLEYLDCLTESSWTETGPVVTADQETLSVWDDSAVPGTARLYRVRLVQ